MRTSALRLFSLSNQRVNEETREDVHSKKYCGDLFCLFDVFACVCVYAAVCVLCDAPVEARGQLEGDSSSFCHVPMQAESAVCPELALREVVALGENQWQVSVGISQICDSEYHSDSHL